MGPTTTGAPAPHKVEQPLVGGEDDTLWLDHYAAITGAASLVKLALQAFIPELRDVHGDEWIEALKTKVIVPRLDTEHARPEDKDPATGMNDATFDGWVAGARRWLLAVEVKPPDPFEVELSWAAVYRWPHFDGRDNPWMKTAQNGREMGSMLLGMAEATKQVPGISAMVPTEYLAGVVAALVASGWTVRATGSTTDGVTPHAKFEGLLVWKRMDQRGYPPPAAEDAIR